MTYFEKSLEFHNQQQQLQYQNSQYNDKWNKVK